MMQRLNNSRLFYFCGVWAMSDDLRRALTHSPLVKHLRDRIQYNQMAFFGVCGGAMLAGATTPYGPGLNLFNGFAVRYDGNIGAALAEVKTNYDERVMQITTGCALVVKMTPDTIAAKSFITIKNGQQ